MSVPVDVVLAMNIGIDEVLDISVKFMDIDIFVTGDFENEDEITDYVKCKIESLRAESEHKEDEDEGK